MNTLIVANQASDCPLHYASATVVSALAYLTDPHYRCQTQVINLCHPTNYQSIGYYVSLLAQARDQQPLPSVKTIEDLNSGVLLHAIAAKLHRQIQAQFADIDTPRIELALYFGKNPDGFATPLGQQLFRLMPAPLLHASFERSAGTARHWQLLHVRSLSQQEIPSHHWPLIRQLAAEYARHRRVPTLWTIRRKRHITHPAIAILYDAHSQEPPSNARAIDKFRQAAQALGMTTEVITRCDASRLAEFDALFIRDTTSINHYTYHLSRQAAANGLIVMDDPDSILKCTNKVYLHEIFQRHHLPVPSTLIVHRGNIGDIIPRLGLPCILKQPDGAFSLGVVKIQSEQQLARMAGQFLKHSKLILAQQYLPTTFDWRIGVLDRRPLFACKYFMAPGHWQIIKRRQEIKLSEGQASAVPLAQVPACILDTALKAANLIGDGFYGVDLKQLGQHCCIIEINDNPNVDMGNEDGILQDVLYHEVMQVFRNRIAVPGERGVQ